jgi:hypothetical protein
MKPLAAPPSTGSANTCGKTGKTSNSSHGTQKPLAGKPGLSRGKTSGKPTHKPLKLTGSGSWSGRVIFARDLEPILSRLEPTPTGPRLHLESETFTAILPASPHILKLLASKLQTTITA